jgi:uncharacterized Zn-binding protein involved in type VI secretion
MLPMARMMDIAVGICTAHKTPINTIGYVMAGCSTVLINGLPAGRMMDMVITACGHYGYIVNGSSTVLTQSIPAARMSDNTMGPFIGTIVQGSSNVLCV